MSRTITTFAASLLALAACGGSSSETAATPTGAGGKADGATDQTCEPGRKCLEFKSYEVLFTNPLCETYAYDDPMELVSGDTTPAKPKNVYCTKEFDSENSGTRDISPQTRILEWLDETGAGDEVFLAYLSFSDAKVADALCSAIDRGAEVTFVLDQIKSKAEQVIACGGEVLARGHQGSVGFAHDKILMINPRSAGPADDDDKFVRMSFGSGNMSSGTHLHHENWHFTEVARDSFFVASHLCLIDALITEEHTDGKGAFRSFMNECRDTITFEPEDDMIPYFIPVRDDSKALTAKLLEAIDDAETIDIGAHRFSYTTMIDALTERLEDASRPFHLRFVADDDLYWLDPLAGPSREVGPNTFNEAIKLRELRTADGDRGRFEEAYLETNNNLFLLHHNKFLVFSGMDSGRDALMFGSSNLTGTGFEGNLENMYYTDIPVVVEAFQNQFGLFWDGDGELPPGMDVAPVATPRDEMPVDLVAVTEPSQPGMPGMPAMPGTPVDPGAPGACGIRIAEVFYDAVGSDTGREWIKLYNNCPDTTSLEGLSLGWGGGSYTRGAADLGGEIKGGECLVIGGPSADASVDIAHSFSPALQNSGTVADGVALFDDKSFAIDESSTPIDAVIYGARNDDGLVDAAGDAVEPHVDDAASGDALVRTGETLWTIDTPAPAECPTW